jgi:putative transposase
VPTKRKPTRTTFPGGVRSENLLVSTAISGPNRAWVADITYIATEEGFLYLALVTDLYSRKIIGWDLSNSLSLEGALRAMERALAHAGGKVAGLIHHSDHGVQYTSRDYLALLQQADVRSSMGAVGNAYDNAVAERVNGILKLEFSLDQRFADAASAHRAVAEAIHLYNTKRPHLSLDYATPAEVYTRGLQQTGAQPAIAEPDQEAPGLSRGEDRGRLRLAQPLTGSSFLAPSELAGCASASNSSYGKVHSSS